jgi:hypothetical protein
VAFSHLDILRRNLVRYLESETIRLLNVTREFGVQLKVLRTAWVHICVNTLGRSYLYPYVFPVNLMHFTFMFPWIVIDFFLSNQPEALIIPILFCYKTLHVSGIFSAHRQEFSTAHSGLVSFMQVLMIISASGWVFKNKFNTVQKLKNKVGCDLIHDKNTPDPGFTLLINPTTGKLQSSWPSP